MNVKQKSTTLFAKKIERKVLSHFTDNTHKINFETFAMFWWLFELMFCNLSRNKAIIPLPDRLFCEVLIFYFFCKDLNNHKWRNLFEQHFPTIRKFRYTSHKISELIVFFYVQYKPAVNFLKFLKAFSFHRKPHGTAMFQVQDRKLSTHL